MPIPALNKLPKVLLGSFANLPDLPGIYYCVDGASRVWYAGISTASLRERHRNHERYEDFLEAKVSHTAYWVIENLEELHEQERGAIALYDPPLNRNLKPRDELPLVQLEGDVQDWFLRYLEINQMMAALEKELDEIKPNIVSYLEQHEGKVKTNLGAAWINNRPIWQYSDEVSKLEYQVKKRQKYEKETGIAKITHNIIFPVIRQAKLFVN